MLQIGFCSIHVSASTFLMIWTCFRCYPLTPLVLVSTLRVISSTGLILTLYKDSVSYQELPI